MKKIFFWIYLVTLIVTGFSCSDSSAYQSIEFKNGKLKISFFKKSIHPYFAEYERYIVIENETNKTKKKYDLGINTGGKTFFNFYIDRQYEFKDEIHDVLVVVDKDVCMAFNTASLEHIGRNYFHRRTDSLIYIGSIRHNSFYSPINQPEELISFEHVNFSKSGVPYRMENEYRATDLIFNINSSLPIDTSQMFNNVGFIVMDKEREIYYVVDFSQKIDTIPLKDWMKSGKGGKYKLARFKEPIWEFEYDAICYEMFKNIGKKVNKEKVRINDNHYGAELIWNLLKKYKQIEVSIPKYRDGSKMISIESILNSSYLEEVNKK